MWHQEVEISKLWSYFNVASGGWDFWGYGNAFWGYGNGLGVRKWFLNDYNFTNFTASIWRVFSFLLFRCFLLDFSCFTQESLLNKKKLILRSKLGTMFVPKIEFISFCALLHRIEFHDEISIFKSRFFRFVLVY